jgi:hypothetical protein
VRISETTPTEFIEAGRIEPMTVAPSGHTGKEFRNGEQGRSPGLRSVRKLPHLGGALGGRLSTPMIRGWQATLLGNGVSLSMRPRLTGCCERS